MMKASNGFYIPIYKAVGEAIHWTRILNTFNSNGLDCSRKSSFASMNPWLFNRILRLMFKWWKLFPSTLHADACSRFTFLLICRRSLASYAKRNSDARWKVRYRRVQWGCHHLQSSRRKLLFLCQRLLKAMNCSMNFIMKVMHSNVNLKLI